MSVNSTDYDSSSTSSPPAEPPRPRLQAPNINRLSNPLLSTLSYFTEPVRYTTSSLFRRLSEDEAPTPLAKALSANYNGSMTDPTTGVYHPPLQPVRKRSPFQPPPLTPLSLDGYKRGTSHKAKLLRKAVAEEIRLLIPPRLQLQEKWHLVYSIDQNGSTLSTLYNLCDQYRGKRGGFVVVVRDASGGVFGAYLSDPPKPQSHYYGNGECFLWRALVLPALPDLMDLPPPPSEDTTHAQRMTTIGVARNGSSGSLASQLSVPGTNGHANGGTTPERIRFKAFPYTGENDFTIFCQQDYFSVGGGDGHYGLWLDQGLGNGVSATCPTFGNEPLSEEGSKFDVMGVEIWYVGS
ncbi:Putative TLDc domain-containing protein [Septoria linicola]|uniref:Oxidation resistance protein 1 n=1 Tax=Septoria linicola TaxID=215465 RepID=A0A9Q9B8J3_9PEZI|nr:putative TLDc domain-containing protein [Septoria linicola]USW59031.1 Putative TLDc domain-containing protein [Septoria linicola]